MSGKSLLPSLEKAVEKFISWLLRFAIQLLFETSPLL